MPPPSHAREGAIPGTVDLTAAEGEATSSSYGQALYPVPTDDPNDPLLVFFFSFHFPPFTRWESHS